jgi:hypothetical protein
MRKRQRAEKGTMQTGTMAAQRLRAAERLAGDGDCGGGTQKKNGTEERQNDQRWVVLRRARATNGREAEEES